MTMPDVVLYHEVQRLYHEEAWLLDELRFAEWLELFTDDLRYRAPLRTNRLRRQQALAVSQPDELAYFDETKDSLHWRIRRFDSGMAWAEDPPSRTRHLITNLIIDPADPNRATSTDSPEETHHHAGEIEARTAFLVYRNRLEHETDLYSGCRTDLLRRDADGRLRIARRLILLDNTVLLAKNLSTFL